MREKENERRDCCLKKVTKAVLSAETYVYINSHNNLKPRDFFMILFPAGTRKNDQL